MDKTLITDTQVGTVIQSTVDDDYKVDITRMVGSYQQTVTVQGKNLFDKAKCVNIGFVADDGTLFTSSTDWNTSGLIKVQIVPYTISGAHSTEGVVLGFYSNTGTFISRNTNKAIENSVYTFTPPNGTSYIKISAKNNETYRDKETIQLELGSTATTYAPFVPNSPSPDYPAPITMPSNFDVVSSIGGRNLVLGTTAIVTKTGTGQINEVRSMYSIQWSSIRGKRLTVSFDIESTSPSGTWFIQLYGEPWSLFCAGTFTNTTKTHMVNTIDMPDVDSSVCSMQIRLDNVIGTVAISNLKLETGSEATTWIPAPEDVPYSVSTQGVYKINIPYELGALPNGVADIIEKRGDGKTYYSPRKVKAVFDGSADEGWFYNSAWNGVNTAAFYIDIPSKACGITNLISNLFTTSTNGNIDIESVLGESNTNVIYIRINKSRLSTQDVSGLKTFLAANPVTVYYEPATPTETIIPDITLTTYKGTTNIFSTAIPQVNMTAVFKQRAYDTTRYLNLITSEHSDKQKFKKMLDNSLKKVDISYLDFDASFELDSAEGQQLDMIGDAIGLSRSLSFQPTGGVSSVLGDEDYRSLLKAKIIYNQWDGTMEKLSDALKTWNPSLNFVIKDNQDMSMDVTVIGANQLQNELIRNGYVIPKMAGVKINYNISTSIVFTYDSNTSTLAGYDTGSWL